MEASGTLDTLAPSVDKVLWGGGVPFGGAGVGLLTGGVLGDGVDCEVRIVTLVWILIRGGILA